MDIYEQGESIDREILLADGTTPFDSNDFLTISVQVKRKYSLDDAGTYSIANGKLSRESETGVVFFDIPPSVSATLPVGIYLYEVTTTETDSDFDGGIRTRVYQGDCFKLIAKISS